MKERVYLRSGGCGFSEGILDGEKGCKVVQRKEREVW